MLSLSVSEIHGPPSMLRLSHGPCPGWRVLWEAHLVWRRLTPANGLRGDILGRHFCSGIDPSRETGAFRVLEIVIEKPLVVQLGELLEFAIAFVVKALGDPDLVPFG